MLGTDGFFLPSDDLYENFYSSFILIVSPLMWAVTELKQKHKHAFESGPSHQINRQSVATAKLFGYWKWAKSKWWLMFRIYVIYYLLVTFLVRSRIIASISCVHKQTRFFYICLLLFFRCYCLFPIWMTTLTETTTRHMQWRLLIIVCFIRFNYLFHADVCACVFVKFAGSLYVCMQCARPV